MEIELQDLEDAYAQCLADEVDLETLKMLWLRIKAIQNEILSSSTTT